MNEYIVRFNVKLTFFLKNPTNSVTLGIVILILVLEAVVPQSVMESCGIHPVVRN